MAKLLRRLMAVSAPVALLLLETAGYRIPNSICALACDRVLGGQSDLGKEVHS